MKKSSKYLFIAVIILVAVFTYLFWVLDIVEPFADKNMPLPNTFLTQIPNPESNYTSRSPEIVTSILWDHRGIDTYYETAVLFIAIVSTLYLLSLGNKLGEGIGRVLREYTVIAKLVTKLVAIVISVVAVSIALHGHLTPGGGFQGGVVFVIAPLLLLMVYGVDRLYRSGFREKILLFLRTTGVSLIGFTGASILLVGLLLGYNTYLFQNQPKPWTSNFGFPYQLMLPWGSLLFSGSLMILNILEFIAVSTGFTLALLLVEKYLGGGK